MNFLRTLFRRREPVTFSGDDNVYRLRVTVPTQIEGAELRRLDKPTCQRINLAQWRLDKARRKAKASL